MCVFRLSACLKKYSLQRQYFPNIGLHILPIFVGCPNIFPDVFPIVYQYFPDMSSWCNLLPKRLGKCAAPNIGKILAKYAETQCFCIFCQYVHFRGSAYFPNISRLGPRLPAYFLHIFPISGPAYWELFPNIGLHILPIFVGCPNIFPMFSQ